jgi:hypothetical protein
MRRSISARKTAGSRHGSHTLMPRPPRSAQSSRSPTVGFTSLFDASLQPQATVPSQNRGHKSHHQPSASGGWSPEKEQHQSEEQRDQGKPQGAPRFGYESPPHRAARSLPACAAQHEKLLSCRYGGNRDEHTTGDGSQSAHWNSPSWPYQYASSSSYEERRRGGLVADPSQDLAVLYTFTGPSLRRGMRPRALLMRHGGAICAI